MKRQFLVSVFIVMLLVFGSCRSSQPVVANIEPIVIQVSAEQMAVIPRDRSVKGEP